MFQQSLQKGKTGTMHSDAAMHTIWDNRFCHEVLYLLFGSQDVHVIVRQAYI